MKKIILLGASGSIGQQTLTVVKSAPQNYQLHAVAVRTNIETILKAIIDFEVTQVCIFDEQVAQNFRQKYQQQFPEVTIFSGMTGLISLVQGEGDVVVNALVGSVGVLPTIEALKTHKDVALANKETLVMAGEIVMAEAQKSKGNIIPVDSEHSAIFQCLENNYKKELAKIIITASGGSLRDIALNELPNITKQQVLAHPNWSMGQKITVDSATMMNKGFEVIEAKYLFNIPYEKIIVMQHRESRIHSMVEYIDGSILAHLGVTDMRIPIQYALTYPARQPLTPSTAFDWGSSFQLNFEPLDYERFPLLRLAFEVGKIGGTLPAVLNAANEIAVAYFLQDKIPFYKIPDIITAIVTMHQPIKSPKLEQLLEIDAKTRIDTINYMKKC